MMIEAKGFHKLIMALYPENDPFLTSDSVFGVKESPCYIEPQLHRTILAVRCAIAFLSDI
jgi:hypothetical protein